MPHSCRNCGAHVDHFGHHGLTCKKGRGWFFRHSSLNDIINRALATAGVPSQLEPSGLARSDGKRPDGMSLVPWEKGKPLVWDVTIPDTLAVSYRSVALNGTGSVAASAESRKIDKYSTLSSSYLFSPIAIESLGALGPLSRKIVKEIGRRLCNSSHDKRAHSFLLQRLSVAVQRGNALMVQDTLPSTYEPLYGT